MVGLDRLELLAHHPEQAGLEILQIVEPCADRGDVVDVRAVVKRLDQVLFGAEVVVGVAECDAGPLGDGAHGGRLVAALAEQLERGREDFGFRGDRFGPLFHAAPRSTGERGSVSHGLRRPSLWSMCMLKKCMPPSTIRTCPIFTDSSSMAPCNPMTGAVVLSARLTNPKFTR